MSVKLRFEKGSLVTQVVLKDGALLGLNKIVSEFQSDEAVSAAPFILSATRRLISPATQVARSKNG